MKPVFDPNFQEINIESRIVAALERISEVFRVMLWSINKKHNLSPLQIQILIFLYYHPETVKTVTYLAHEFNMTKATISDAIRILQQKTYVMREKSMVDSRIAILSLTEQGKLVAQDVASFADDMRDYVALLPKAKKELLSEILLGMIARLNKEGKITVTRMCLSCYCFTSEAQDETGGYCQKRQKQFSGSDLLLDCSGYKKKKE